jgi:chromosome segregation ATPase
MGEPMTLDERVAYLEGRLEDHSGAVASLRNNLLELRGEVRDLRGEMQTLRGDMHVFRREMQGEIHALLGDLSRQFTWLVGIQVASLIAIFGALVRLT